MTDPRLLAAVGDFVLSRLDDDRPALIGLSGSQGSGKSTVAAEIANIHGGVTISLDDFYLTLAQRLALSEQVHPLLRTRGVPLTHDMDLMHQTIEALLASTSHSVTSLPVFDKLADDRRPKPRLWHGRPRFILLEGWCLGATAQPLETLIKPLNGLEANHDVDGQWRGLVNDALGGPYRQLRARLDGLIYLQAPSFNAVLDWRCQQQAGLLGVPEVDEKAREDIRSFIAYFERITRGMLDGGVQADLKIVLDYNRQMVA